MDFSEGDIVCITGGGSYQCFKILQALPSLLVRIYWPEHTSPVSWHAETLAVQRTCEELDPGKLMDAQKIGSEAVTSYDKEEIANYLRISQGLRQRKELLSELLERADREFVNENWQEAVHLYTETTSFARNNPEIFEKRGACYLKLGRAGEAKADLDHAANLRNNK